MQNSQKDALSRRAFVGKLATGAAGAALAIAATTGRADAVPRKTGGSATLPEGGHVDLGAEAIPPLAEAEREQATPETVVDAAPPAPWQILEPLTVGALVASDWRVVDFQGAVDGACVLTLGNDRGRTNRVHVCRNDGQPRGLVYTSRFDLVVMNGGRGDLPTEEGFGLAVAEIAHTIAANETSSRGAEVASALLPQSDREQRFAATARLR